MSQRSLTLKKRKKERGEKRRPKLEPWCCYIIKNKEKLKIKYKKLGL